MCCNGRGRYLFLHCWHQACNPRVLAMSYIDNLELLSDRLLDLLDSVDSLHRFCSLLDLPVDLDSLYVWSSSPSGRRDLISPMDFVSVLGDGTSGARSLTPVSCGTGFSQTGFNRFSPSSTSCAELVCRLRLRQRIFGKSFGRGLCMLAKP